MDIGNVLRSIGDKFANIGKHKEQPSVGEKLSEAKISKAASSAKVIEVSEKSTTMASVPSAKIGHTSTVLEKFANAIGNIIKRAIAAIKSGVGIKTVSEKSIQHQKSISDQQKE